MKKLMGLSGLVLMLSGCLTAVPGAFQPVANFEAERYTGVWYELYRLNHPFEDGLSHVTATYTLQDDDSLVENEGMREDGSMSYIEGRAVFQGEPTVGSLNVSFFGPFYSGYHIIALDQENYDYALIAGGSYDYLWILSRTPTLDQAIVDELLMQAVDGGYDLTELIEVDQS